MSSNIESLNRVLVTGASGHVASRVLRLLPQQRSSTRETSWDTVALLHRGAADAQATVSADAGEVLCGDIRLPNLGLPLHDYERLRYSITAVLHCAAVTRFSVARDEAHAVNVEGTRNVLKFAAAAPRLERFGYVSTTFVAGCRTGVIAEDELVHGEGFVNAYEWSKYEAEQLVRASDLPWATYRLSTLVGEGATGRVTGWNALHKAFELYYLGLAPLLPGRPETPVDLVPDEFATGALHALFFHHFQPGATYHLCAGAGKTLPLADLLALVADSLNASRPAWRARAIAPPALVDWYTFDLLGRSAREVGNATFVQVFEAMRHFVPQLLYPKTFDCTAASRALQGTGITAPPLESYLRRVVEYCVATSWDRRPLPSRRGSSRPTATDSLTGGNARHSERRGS